MSESIRLISAAIVARVIMVTATGLCVVPAVGQTVSQVASKRPQDTGAPKASDVCFSDRLRGAFDMMKAFHATRLEWIYTRRSKQYIADARAHGFGFLSASIFPPALADTPGSTTYEVGRAITLDGSMFTWPGRIENHGCYNNPAYRRIWLKYARVEVDAGADAIQVDSCGYGDYLLQRGGCYCPFCVARFRDHLRQHTSAAERAALEIEDLSHFDYADYLRQKNESERLAAMFRDFQRESSLEFLRDVQQQIDAYAGRRIRHSMNPVGPLLEFFYPVHDYGVCEAYARTEAVPKYFYYERMRPALEIGKPIVWTLAAKDLSLNRRFLAMCYALGSHMIVPWDVYLPSDSRRHYGKPEEYADLYGFVRAIAKYLEGYEEAAVAGPGLYEDRYGDAPPLRIEAGHDVYAVVRAIPDQPDAPVVVHLVDHSDEPESFTVILDPTRLFGNRPMKLRLLTPSDYEKGAHEAAEASQDFSSLSQCLDLPGGCLTMVRIPVLEPWGTLVLEPDEVTRPAAWQPMIWTDESDHYTDQLRVRIRSATPGATIRYTTDGSQPTNSAAVYTDAIVLQRAAVVRAVLCERCPPE